ncbi:MAG: HAMP domain-containing sensor histidine kinase, partial [Acidobacteriota bacterium]
STDRFARDLERDFQSLWYVFSVRSQRRAGLEIAEDYEEWVESSDFPDLVAAAYWVSDDGERQEDAAERLSIARVSLTDGSIDPLPWPQPLATLREPLARSADEHRGRNFHRSDGFTMPLDDGNIAFVVAQTSIDPKSWAIAVLRRNVLVDGLLPALVRHHFGTDGERDYDVRLVDTLLNGAPLFSSAQTGSAAAAFAADYTRHLRGFGGTFVSRDDPDARSLAVEAIHRAGSVDTAVAQLRRRNLAFSFGVILVLAASVMVLGVAARRSRRLAQRQMEFVAGISHELRTPIAGISSLSQNLADGVVQDLKQAARYGETIHRESRRLGNMVEGVLQFSAIRAGGYRFEMGAAEVASFIDDAVAALDPKLMRQATLDVDIEAGLPTLHGDERALRMVVGNLVSNALKFSGQGGRVHLSAALAPGRHGAEVVLRVQDSGPGIAAGEVPSIFEPFYRGHAAQEHQIEGSGLGLSLVKEIVEAHAGRIEVSSRAGEGSVFSVHLPVAATPDRSRHGRRSLDPAQVHGAGDGGGAR